ncbi:MAG: hypothetical protein ACTSU5_08225 [Promethearchaeota archaeon]
MDLGAEIKNPKLSWGIFTALAVNLVLAAVATAVEGLSGLWVATLVIAIGLLVALGAANPSKSWFVYIIFGVVGASLVSAAFGTGGIILAGFAPAETFWVGFLGWFTGDLIVLSTISTVMLVCLTGRLKKTPVFVENWWS